MVKKYCNNRKQPSSAILMIPLGTPKIVPMIAPLSQQEAQSYTTTCHEIPRPESWCLLHM
jgi:hypothetical protein